MTFDSLPVIVVTAQTKTAADEIITEIIENMDATSEVRPSGHESPDRVWRLLNKYYSALVRVHARAYSETPRSHAGGVGAHVVHLAPNELEDGVAERRVEEAAWEGPEAEVNVLACEAGVVPEALEALCARRRLEPVALRPPDIPDSPDSPDPPDSPELCGLPALRAALHAHTWPGLQRRADAVAELGSGLSSSSGGSEAETEADAEAEWELRSEGFARALDALSSGAEQAMRLQGSARRAAAEELVAAFAAVISHPRP